MLFLAGDYSLSALRSGNHTASDLYQAGHGRWRTSGTRPANHPRQRLFQYEDWINQRPLWPSDLETLLKRFPQVANSEVLSSTRKSLGLAKIRPLLAENVVGGAVGGTRIENLIFAFVGRKRRKRVVFLLVPLVSWRYSGRFEKASPIDKKRFSRTASNMQWRITRCFAAND